MPKKVRAGSSYTSHKDKGQAGRKRNNKLNESLKNIETI
jgi:hypothetical protein